MSIVQMSFSGAVLILAVVVLRALAMNRLPKDTFLILWGIVLLRLLVPFSVPSQLSVYSWMEQKTRWELRAGTDLAMGNGSALKSIVDQNTSPVSDTDVINDENKKHPPENNIAKHSSINANQPPKYDINVTNNTTQSPSLENDMGVMYSAIAARLTAFYVNIAPICSVVWCVGMFACMIYFIAAYLRCSIEFQTSFPVENSYARHWLEKHRRRLVTIRQSDRISTPLTYGIWRPVILMPKDTDWENTQQLQYVLMHEYVHICRFDALTKLVCVLALCIHWFNPLVWIMYVLLNQDVEISCDEHVVRRFGVATRSAYAKMLIQMEARRSNVVDFLPLGSGLLLKIGKNAMEERIMAIMKMKKKSVPAVALAAVLVISVTAVFATSAAEQTEKTNTGVVSGTDFTDGEWQKLLALQLDGYENMSISDYQEKVWTLTDTEEYRELLERFSQDEILYAIYEGKGTADQNTKEMLSFFYNIYEPLTGERWRTRDFGGYAVTDYSGASDNAGMEYTVTLTVLDADALTVGEYDDVRRSVMGRLNDFFQKRQGELLVTELRDEELMQMLIDEEIVNIKATYGDRRLRIAVSYFYTPLGEVPAEEMDDWMQESAVEWENMVKPYVPFGLTYRYDWDTDEYRMYFKGKEVRAIYDTVQNKFISTHIGIGEGIYADDAVDLYVEYDGRKVTGLREATPQEMEEATKKRRAVTEAYQNGQEKYFDSLREDVPATEEDYQSLFSLKTPDYRAKSIADFNGELLEWTNQNFERKERIAVDNMYADYRVLLTEEEKKFAATTVHLSTLENAAYVRSIQKSEPERDVVEDVFLRDKEAFDQGSNRSAWCTLYYTFSYHISDKETVSVGERDRCIGGMMDSVLGFWESSPVDYLVAMTDEEMRGKLHEIAGKFSSDDIAITILDDQFSFERMDEREPYKAAEENRTK